jgi:pimeloyl-ACP methyl ester carboxylesterase
MPPRHRRRALVSAVGVALAASGCSSDRGPTSPGGTGRGSLVEAALAQSLPRTVIEQFLLQQGLSGAFTARYGVQMYAIRYRTVDVSGAPTIATGAVFLPTEASGAVPLMSYSHGTATLKSDVPSNPQSGEGLTVGALFATTGAVVAMADYLGMGGNPGVHPYVHAASEASAGIDALRAARTLVAQKHVGLSSKLFVFGYSQGGQAAMALVKEIEEHAASEFAITAAAPMSGPYDMYGTAKTFLASSSPNVSASIYTVYAMGAYNAVYHFADGLDQLLKPPYDQLAGTLASSGMAFDQVAAAVAAVPRDMVQPAVLDAVLNHPESAISTALRDNDLYDWRPATPMRLYYGSADTDVPPQNALTAAAHMQALGATNVQAVDLGPYTHTGAIVPAFIAAVTWFESLR